MKSKDELRNFYNSKLKGDISSLETYRKNTGKEKFNTIVVIFWAKKKQTQNITANL